MSFMDDSMKERLRKAQQKNEPEEREFDANEYYLLQAKMLGVLVRDARLSASRTIEDCADMVGVSPQTFQGWEYGDAAPTLPQLEILAFYLGVPVSHFWGQNTLRDEYTGDRRSEQDYIQLRTRMVGVLLRQAREEAGMSVDALAEDARLPVERVRQYEMGDTTIPMHELTVMARSVNKTMSYFLDSSGMIGELLATREEWKHFAELPDDVRAFAANPVNIGFIEIAIMLSQMPTEKLRRVGSSIVDITM